jgi:hypothetical protein
MPAKGSYLVRGPGGQMATVVAHSVRGALRLYLHQHRPPPGSFVSVKPRGEGDWAHFKVTR